MVWSKLSKAVIKFAKASAAKSGSSPAPSMGDSSSGDLLIFEYQDEDGVVTMRTVEDWYEHDRAFTGYCNLRKAERTFLRRRVLEWYTGEDLLTPLRDLPPEPRRKERAAPVEVDDILFTGFSKAERARLEAAAEDNGLVVRSTVTRGLTYLVCGPNAGAAKIAQAEAEGAEILSAEEAEEMFNTDDLAD